MSAVLEEVPPYPSFGSFEEVDLAAAAAGPPAPQRWHWEGLVPAGHVTLLAGHGGTGKSTLAISLAACMAVGRTFLGKRTQPARVLFFSAEDAGSLVARRLVSACVQLGLDQAQVFANLKVLDASGGDPTLFARSLGCEGPSGTHVLGELANYFEALRMDVLIVDNASEVFGANEIDRSHVGSFVRSLARLVRPRDGAVLLLAHVDKGISKYGARSGNAEAYSGSTAWHNSVRSRMALVETKLGRLELQHQKSNLGPLQASIPLTWGEEGALQFDPRGDDRASAEEPPRDQRDDQQMVALLKLLHEYAVRGESVATAHNSPRTAARMFSKEPTYPAGLKAVDAVDLLRRAERAGLLRRETYRTPGRKDHERWSLTQSGCERIGVVPSAPCAPSTELGTGGTVGDAGARQVRQVGGGGYEGGRERAHVMEPQHTPSACNQPTSADQQANPVRSIGAVPVDERPPCDRRAHEAVVGVAQDAPSSATPWVLPRELYERAVRSVGAVRHGAETLRKETA